MQIPVPLEVQGSLVVALSAREISVGVMLS